MRHGRNAAIAAALAVGFASAPGHAASPGAWDAFRAEVSAKCLKAAETSLTHVSMRVDPFGTESYGLALVTGLQAHATKPTTHICVVRKVGGGVELSGETDLYLKR